jgi:hypothetical protein
VGLLTRDVVDQVRDAVETSGLASADVRPLLFEGIAPSFTAKLRVFPEPRYQLVSDLHGMNRVESLPDGTTPLEIWLRNALVLVADPAAVTTLQRVHDRLTRGISDRRDAASAPPSGTSARDSGVAASERERQPGPPRSSDRSPALGPGGPAVFVSYADEDTGWAEWIAWHLEAAGYAVTVRAWDGVAGVNWMRFVDRIAGSNAPLLAVVSAAYLASPEVSREWQAVRQADPDATLRRLVPVLVDGTPPAGYLAGLTPIQLTALAEKSAVDVLLSAVAARARGRARPRSRPRFPGSPDGAVASRRRDERPAFPRRLSDL